MRTQNHLSNLILDSENEYLMVRAAGLEPAQRFACQDRKDSRRGIDPPGKRTKSRAKASPQEQDLKMADWLAMFDPPMR
jgi:hypothetical protein